MPDHDEIPIANASEHDATHRTTLFRMWFGAYRDKFVYVWADHFEDAFEVAVEWLDDIGGPIAEQAFYELGPDEFMEAGRDLGWDDERTREAYQHIVSGHGWLSTDAEELLEAAEADLTPIGHTTLKHGSYIHSDYWGGDDITDEDEIDAVRERSIEDDEDDEDEEDEEDED